MYEKYPYPTRSASINGDCNPQLCLSYREGYQYRTPLQILDAGCGTGTCVLDTALCHPDCQVTGIDVNRVALAQIRSEAEGVGLQNLTLQEVDLNTLDGLTVPEGGFDVICCSGVLHHLAEPDRALKNLTGVLAPHGVLRIMVYNTLGRQGLYRFAEALKLLPAKDLESGLELGRRLMASLKGGPCMESPWGDGPLVDDVEFVDRYLNVHDTSYSVTEFFELIENAGLTFLRWYEPRDWELGKCLEDPSLASELPLRDQYRMVEQLCNNTKLEAYVAHTGSTLRGLPSMLEDLILTYSPQLSYEVRHEVVGASFFEGQPRVSLRDKPPVAIDLREFEMLKKLTAGPARASSLLTSELDRKALINLLRSEYVWWS